MVSDSWSAAPSYNLVGCLSSAWSPSPSSPPLSGLWIWERDGWWSHIQGDLWICRTGTQCWPSLGSNCCWKVSKIVDRERRPFFTRGVEQIWGSRFVWKQHPPIILGAGWKKGRFSHAGVSATQSNIKYHKVKHRVTKCVTKYKVGKAGQHWVKVQMQFDKK